MTEVHANLNDLAFRAESGDPSAQYSLGVIYLLGEAVGQDLAAANKWLGQAAHQQHPEAQVLAAKIAANPLAPLFPEPGNDNSANRSAYDAVIRSLGRIVRRREPAGRSAALSKFRIRFKVRF
jgi:TPR repeat protein